MSGCHSLFELIKSALILLNWLFLLPKDIVHAPIILSSSNVNTALSTLSIIILYLPPLNTKKPLQAVRSCFNIVIEPC